MTARFRGGDVSPGAAFDQHLRRRWTSWRRWTLLAMIGHALLAVIAANASTEASTDRSEASTPSR